jgi:hypothetical protein
MENEILELTCKKHIKIFKLHQQGVGNKQIAELVKTNAGHVWNVLNEYKKHPEKIEVANSIEIIKADETIHPSKQAES